jgi:Kef-type K+ transport system membrane component KefB
LSKVQDNEDAYLVLMLGIMAVAGVVADYINLPSSVGAFLAGLAVNTAVGEHPGTRSWNSSARPFSFPASSS